MTSFFEGDPKIYIDGDGANLNIVNGQPDMDQGVENEAVINLFSDDWFGNVFFRDKNQKIGGEFEAAHKQPITRTNLSVVSEAAIDAFKQSIDSGLFLDVVAETENLSANHRRTTIIVKPPGENLIAIRATHNGQNWINQIEKGLSS